MNCTALVIGKHCVIVVMLQGFERAGVLGSIGKNRPDAVISAAMIWDISAQPGPPAGALSEASDAAIENRS
jgi:hypothetical protein